MIRGHLVTVLVAVVLHPLLSDEAHGTQNPILLRGRTVEVGSEASIGIVDVELLDAQERRLASSTSDSTGRFRLTPGKAGSYRLRARALGHRTVVTPPFEVADGDTLDIVVWLAVEAVPLAPLEIVARRGPANPNPFLAAFYRRVERDLGGRFILREEIELRKPRLTTDLLITSGLYVVGEGLYMRRTGCAPAIYLDGIPLDRSRSPRFAYDAVNAITPFEVEGIEVYSGPATVPPEFGGSTAGCGVIVIWGRRGGGS